MKNKYFGFICMIILASFLIKSALALTPYKIEIKELPIKGYDVGSGESKPAIADDYIAYRSNFNEIILYNIKTGNSKIITGNPIKVRNIQLSGNNLIYIAYYKNDYRELVSYNILTNKTFAIIPLDNNFEYYITDDKLIAFPYCQHYDKIIPFSDKNYSYCIREVLKSSIYGQEVVVFDLNVQYDFPPSLQVAKCKLGINSIKQLDGLQFKKSIYPENPKEKEKCVSCNILTGENISVPLEECSGNKQNKCGIGNRYYSTALDNFWEVDLQSNPQKLCYSNDNINYSLTYFMEGIKSYNDFSNIAGFKDKVVFFSFDGKGYLGQVVYGNIKKICESFSNNKIDGTSKIEYNCQLNREQSCNCNFYGVDNLFNYSYSTDITFDIINNDEKNIEKNILEFSATKVKNELNLKNSQQIKLIEEQKNKKIKKEILMIVTMFSIIVISITAFIWRRRLYGLEIKRRLEEQRKKEADEERQIILRKKLLEEEKKLKENEKFRKSQEAKGLVEYKGKWGTPEQVKKWKEIEYGIDSNFMNLSHFEFEKFIAKLFRKMDYMVELTPKTGDYGVDIIAKDKNDTIAIQAKQFKHGNNVSNTIVQQVLGAMWKVKANKAIIITTSDFTVQAKVQAREAPVELWNLQTLKSMVRKYFIEETKIKQ